jgi:HD superfamily phosphohydrolase
LVGGANINRYEHALGTFYLAQQCLKARPLFNPISEKEQEHLLLAALLHDIASSAFGHSVEYIESKLGFDHEKAFLYVVLGERSDAYQYRLSTLEPVFFGLPRELLKKIPIEDLQAIGKIIAGKTRLGPLINSTIDLDNIDNVFRLGYHVGIVKSGETPLKLAKSIYVENDRIVFRKEAIPLVEEWYEIRKKLYFLLLLNPEEFSAKCMLTEAIELSKTKLSHPFNWYDVDFELLQKLSGVSSDSSNIVSRLMKGELYGCGAILSTSRTDKYNLFTITEKRKELEDGLSQKLRSKFRSSMKSVMIAMHPIIDVNKTQRQVTIETDDGRSVKIGTPTSRLLVGVFFKNVDLSIHRMNTLSDSTIDGIRKEIRDYMSNSLSDPNILELELYGELKDV